jgi:hypothetical protein
VQWTTIYVLWQSTEWPKRQLTEHTPIVILMQIQLGRPIYIAVHLIWNCAANAEQLLGVFAKLRKRLLASSCLSLCPSVHMQQLGSHWTDFNEIRNLSIFQKSVERIQVSSKSDKNNGHFTRRTIYWRTPVSTGNTFQDLPRLRETADNTGRYI